MTDKSGLSIDEHWNNFKVKFERKYESDEEEKMRKKIFIETFNRIEEHNKRYEQNLESYTQGINQFSDRTSEERRRMC